MNNNNKESAEQDFKDNVFKILSEHSPEAKIDKDGFLVIPMRRRKKRDQNPPTE